MSKAAPLSILALLLTSGLPAAAQATWHVDVDGTAPGTGTLADPYTDIQYAFVQPTTGPGDLILVQPGTYVGNLNLINSEHTSIVIESVAGPLETILEPLTNDDIVLMHGVMLRGFTLRGALPGSAAVRVPWGGVASVDRCLIVNNALGVHWEYDGSIIRSTIANNEHGVLIDWDGILGMNSTILSDNLTELTTTPSAYGASVACTRYCRLPYWINFDWFCPQVELGVGAPGFWDAQRGELGLVPASPCVDAGDPNLPLDADGSRADIGALPQDGHVPPPFRYCSALPNSSGAPARISRSGSTSVGAGDLVLRVNDAAASQPGLFSYGPNRIQLPFGDGWRCIGGGSTGTFRLPPLVTDPSGAAATAVDFGSAPAGQGAGALLPGTNWNFQFFFRDPAAGGAGFNLSDGLSIYFGQ